MHIGIIWFHIYGTESAHQEMDILMNCVTV